MDNMKESKVSEVLDRFVEGLYLLILDHHHRHIAQMELTMVQAQALRLLGAAPISTTELARSLGISPPAVSQLTDRLVRKQLIARRTGDRDRRLVTIELTDRGRRLVENFRQRRNALFEDVLARLPAEDRPEVVDALDKIAGVLKSDIPVRFAKKPKAGRPRRQPVPARTAVRRPDTSNVVEEIPPVTPRPKRMRIEWD